MIAKKILVFFSLLTLGYAQTQAEVDAGIVFTVYDQATNTPQISTFNDTVIATKCPAKIYLIIHGWNEKITTAWVPPLIQNYLTYGGNESCVIFMDYSKYSVVADYFVLTAKYSKILVTLIKKLWQIKRYEDLTVYGFSFGARLAQGAGFNLTMANNGVIQIDRLELCDPAGPGFDGLTVRIKEVQKTAKNVACINTSTDKGTSIYDCHQNFLLGDCGRTQPGATVPPMMSHGMCPYFYNNAFTIAYTANNPNNKCTHVRKITDAVAAGAQIGFLNTNRFNGVCFVSTAKCKPWLVVNNVILNYPAGKTTCPA